MAVELALFRVSKLAERFESEVKRIKRLEFLDEILIDAKALAVCEEMLPMIEKANAFISLKDFDKVSYIADEIIEDYPESAVGWYVKAVAASENFEPENNFIKDWRSGFIKFRRNALKRVNAENKPYIVTQFKRYDQTNLFCTEAVYINKIQSFVNAWLEHGDFDDEAIVPALLMSRVEVSKYEEDGLFELILKAHPNNLIFCLYHYFFQTNLKNAQNQYLYYGATQNDNTLDYYKRKPVEDMPLSTETVDEFFARMNLNPPQSQSGYTDGYISLVATACRLLQIEPVGIEKYYSEEAKAEIAQLELEEKREQEEEARREREAARRREAERLKAEQDRKNRKRKETIKNFVIAGVSVLAVIILWFSFKDDISRLFGIGEQNTDLQSISDSIKEEQEYYIIADGYDSINVRKGPGKNNSVVTTVKSENIKMKPTGKTNGEWIQIQSDEFGTGWVHRSVVKYVSR